VQHGPQILKHLPGYHVFVISGRNEGFEEKFEPLYEALS
jgi:hypothetical protein